MPKTFAPSRSANLDNLTHALVGAALSKAGLERTTPLATTTLVVAANAPDIDVLSYIRGEYFALSFRRGITHGLPALLVLPLIVTVLILSWDRLVRRQTHPDAKPARAGPILALSALGLATHPTLDWMNTYGMRWALPFDSRWSYGDALFIIDPWIWLTIGGATFLASDPARVGRALWGTLAALTTLLMLISMGAGAFVFWCLGLLVILVLRSTRGPGRDGRRAPAVRIASLATALYMLAMIGAGAWARSRVTESASAAGMSVESIMLAPTRGNPFVQDIEIQTHDAYVPGTYTWFRSPSVQLRPEQAVPRFFSAATIPAVLAQRVVAAARTRAAVDNYLAWSRYPYVRVTPDEDGWAVRFSDARYDGQPEAGGLSGVTVHISTTDIQ